MATLQQLERALVNADAAGDTDAARTLASEIVRMRGAAQRPTVTTTEQGKVFRDGQVVYDPATDPTNITDPTSGMSAAEKFFAGMGGKINRAGLAAKDLFVGADEQLAAARERDKALYQTGAGALGGFAADVAMSLPFLGGAGMAARGLGMVPQVARYAAPAAAGAAEFATLQGTTEDQSRLRQAITGGVLGAAGTKVGDVLSGMGRSIFGRAQDEAIDRAQKVGYEVSSAVGGRSTIGSVAQDVGGRNPSFAAAYRNQANTDRLAKEALGITLDDPIETGLRQTKKPYKDALKKIESIPNRFSPDNQLTQDLDGVMSVYDELIEAVSPARKRAFESLFMGAEDAYNPNQLVQLSRYLGGEAKKLFKSTDTNKQSTATRFIEVKNAIDDFLGRKVGGDLANEFSEARTKYAIASNVENAAKGEHVDAQKLANLMGNMKSKSEQLNQIRDAANAIPELTKLTTARESGGGILAPVSTLLTTSPAARAVGRTYPTVIGAARAMGQPMGLLGGMTPAQAGLLGLGLGGE